MSTPIVLGLIRHILTIAGGYLVAQGALEQGQVTEAIGALVTLAGVGWSVWEKQSKHRAPQNPPAPGDTTPPTKSTATGLFVIIGTGLVFLALLGSGCASASKVATAQIRLQCGTNFVTVSQPKDTIIDRMEFDPVTGRLSLYGYQSTANAAAVEANRAQAEAQRQIMGQGFLMLESLAARAAQSQGVPMAPRTSPTEIPPAAATGAPIPATPGRSPVRVKDDPSKPWIQLDLEPAPPPANP